MSQKTYICILTFITLLGGYLRFTWLGIRPFWIDEVIFINMSKNIPFQEFWPVLIQSICGFQDEFMVRLQFALAGTLTIPAVYYVMKDKPTALTVALFVATFPLFVFWSTMARPYAFAGLFMVLSWRHNWCMPIAITTTPFAIFGWRPWKATRRMEWILIPILAILMIVLRQDQDKNFFDVRFLKNAARIYYLPTMAFIMFVNEYYICKIRPNDFSTIRRRIGKVRWLCLVRGLAERRM